MVVLFPTGYLLFMSIKLIFFPRLTVNGSPNIECVSSAPIITVEK